MAIFKGSTKIKCAFGQVFLIGRRSNHARSFSDQIFLCGTVSSKHIREISAFTQTNSPIRMWIRSFSSDCGTCYMCAIKKIFCWGSSFSQSSLNLNSPLLCFRWLG
ncbi:uncharacterized protein LOC122070395 [Macadamia integrifolia]|uniref:uncharacterized protein LOC122070395 n=1 Tax=Macadamia integrifolia TaxID=60698 RepID=UPI001C4E73CB|nr:uncharacterized protein LOC122070395 [Macadamia integrifolia]